MATQAPAVQDPEVSLVVGDFVVYGSHGIGRVAQRGRGAARAGRPETVVVEFAKGLSVTLPLERAVECLRPVAGEAALASVEKTLRAGGPSGDEPWLRRMKVARSKIVEGGTVGLAEVVRDAFRREGKSTPRGDPVRLSAHERELYLKARGLLAAEIGLLRGIDAEAADAWIEEKLAPGPRTK